MPNGSHFTARRFCVTYSSFGEMATFSAANVAANLDHVLRLRDIGLNVFIIDYRGYGHSTGGPPREKLLYEDAQ